MQQACEPRSSLSSRNLRCGFSHRCHRDDYSAGQNKHPFMDSSAFRCAFPGEPSSHLLLVLALLQSLPQWRSDLFLDIGLYPLLGIHPEAPSHKLCITLDPPKTPLAYRITFRMSENPQLPFCTPKG
ncbi:hypothetical protein STEG23_027589 [Scotinomys teguina]